MELISNLFTAWRDSLKIFLPSNLKQFLLLTLKTTKDALVSIAKNLWLDFALIFLLLYLNYSPILSNYILYFWVILIAYYILTYILPQNLLFNYRPNIGFLALLTVSLEYINDLQTSPAYELYNLVFYYYIFANIIAAARPSVEYKDRNYFLSKEHILSNLLAILSIFFFFIYILPLKILYKVDRLNLRLYFSILYFRAILPPISYGPGYGLGRLRSRKEWLWLQIILLIMVIIGIGLFSYDYPHPNLQDVALYFRPDTQILSNIKLIIDWVLKFFMLIFKSTGLFQNPMTYYASPFLIFCALFILDAQNKTSEIIKSFGRAFKMFVFNYPFCFIFFYLFKTLFLFAVNYLWRWMNIGFVTDKSEAVIKLLMSKTLFSEIIFVLILPFYICLFVNFYVKQIHDKFSLYYKKD